MHQTEQAEVCRVRMVGRLPNGRCEPNAGVRRVQKDVRSRRYVCQPPAQAPALRQADL